MESNPQKIKALINENKFLPQKLKDLYLRILPQLQVNELEKVQALFLELNQEEEELKKKSSLNNQTYLQRKVELINTFFKEEKKDIRASAEKSSLKNDHTIENELLAEINQL